MCGYREGGGRGLETWGYGVNLELCIMRTSPFVWIQESWKVRRKEPTKLSVASKPGCHFVLDGKVKHCKLTGDHLHRFGRAWALGGSEPHRNPLDPDKSWIGVIMDQAGDGQLEEPPRCTARG